MQAHPLQNPIPANPPTTNPQSLQLMTEAQNWVSIKMELLLWAWG